MADDSDSSTLSSAPDDEAISREEKKLAPIFLKAKGVKSNYAPKSSPPRPKREPSPPHEEAFADNPDIAFIVMFRSRFNDALPSKLAHLGPQDIERGVQDAMPSQQMESLLCALLALVLNRKKPVERGHHGRALEEAVLSQKSQWPTSWNLVNPLHGNRDFNTMSAVERLNLLRTLIMWSLASSEAIQTIVKEKYKQQRHNDDENQPLSVQPWGNDGDKRRYFLVQGLEDTDFRVYREGSRYTRNAHWYSVAGSIDELKELAKKMEEVDGSQAARRFSARILNAIPTFEASEEKRRRREYRQIRRAAFTRPEPGFSLYEGRTRGKRMRYTYDEDDSFLSDATSTRRSTRPSARNTPFESGPTFTASGRQIKQPRTGEYGESLLNNAPQNATDELSPDSRSGQDGDEDSEPVRPNGRATRSATRPIINGTVNPRKRKHIEGYNSIDDMSDEEDAGPSGDDWDSEKNEVGDEDIPDADDENEDRREGEEEEQVEDDEPQSLVLRLKVSKEALMRYNGPPAERIDMNGDVPQSHEYSHGKPTTIVAKPIDSATRAGAPKVQSAEAATISNSVMHTYQPVRTPGSKMQAEPSSTATYADSTPVSAPFSTAEPKPIAQYSPTMRPAPSALSVEPHVQYPVARGAPYGSQMFANGYSPARSNATGFRPS